MKKVISLLLALALVSMLIVGCGSSAETESGETEAATTETTEEAASEETASSGDVVKIGIAWPYDLDALPWLVECNDWIRNWDAENDQVEVQLAGAPDANQYEPTLRSFADDGCTIICSAFNNFTDAMTAVANDYPDIKFISFEGRFQNIEQFSNLLEVQECKDYEFLSGAAAAMISKNKKIALISGADIAACQEINASWANGARYIDPEIQFDVVVTNTYEDPTVGYETAVSLMKDGYDVLLASAGGTEEGILQAMQEFKDEYGAYYVADATDYSASYPDIELCAVIQNNGKTITLQLDDALQGKFRAGECWKMTAGDGVSTFVIPDSSPLTDEQKAQLAEIEEKLINKEITFDLVLPE